MASQPPVAQVDAVAPVAQPVDANPTTARPPMYPDDQPVQDEPPVAAPPPADATETGEDATPVDVQLLAEDAQNADADLPAIEAPASYDKEAKERFAKLPREDQEYWSKREGDRDREVRRAQNASAEVQRDTKKQAYEAARQYQEQIFGQYRQLAQMVQVQEPDIRLLQSADPQHHAMYHEQDRQYRVASAQYQQIAQAAEDARAQAEQIANQQNQQELYEDYQRLVEMFPEWEDPAGRATLIAELEPIAAALEYPGEAISQASSNDFRALKIAAEWKRDSDELKKLKDRAKMVHVRAAKLTPPAAPQRAPGVTTASKPIGSLAQLYPDDMPK